MVDMAVGRRLLRTHVGGRAERESGLRQALAGRIDGPRHAEVGEHAPLALKEDVLRLDVAVDDVLPLCVSQRFSHLTGDPHRLGQRELGLPRQPLPQRLPVDEGHGEPEPADGLAGVVHRKDVRVVETGGEPDLPNEPLGAERLRQLGVKDLEGDWTLVPEIAGEVDGGHAAAAELALDRIAGTEGIGELVVHRRWIAA